MKRIVIFLTAAAILHLSTSTLTAQIKDVSNMLAGVAKDKAAVENMFQAYLNPYVNALGANLNGGWYNTAKTHKLGGFDLTLSISTSFVPTADKNFDPSHYLKNSQFISVSADGAKAPTVAGDSKAGPALIVKDGNTTLAQFNTPKGTGLGFIPSPMLQLGIGLVKSTDVTVRYLPSFSIGDYGSVNLWGVGVKHSIKQWIPGIKLAPFFHLTAQVGYTQLKTNFCLNLQPEQYSNAIDETTLPYNNQKMELIAKNLTGNILASFDFPIIAVYAGVGFSNTNTTLALTGDYPIPSIRPASTVVVVRDENKITNPLDMEFSSVDGSKTKPRLNGGIRFKFAIITLHFDYTYANYSVATAGLGISFR
jgi:hypothetical protein